MFRLGPFGINVPAGHIYEPGTNTLLTSWKTPTGWATVREALTMKSASRRGHHHTTYPAARPTRTPITCSCALRSHASTAAWRSNSCASPPSTMAAFPASGLLSDDRRSAHATGAGQRITLTTDMLIGIQGNQARARRV